MKYPVVAAEIRNQFIRYFINHQHAHVPSSPLTLHEDPTLMFVNAGMVQFKDIFLGVRPPPYSKAVTCQKCLRVSGKHNDLEEVGRSQRHHTFFEMLGNFSFGDYFKEEAITRAWQLIHHQWQLPSEKLWVTYFGGDATMPADDETRQLWSTISGLPPERILAKGAQDNFWSMGEIGPCGPCTEIHIDLGNGPVTPADFDNGRIVEIWNNVFMQYQREPSGEMKPLPTPCVDTGMGLERIAAILNGETSNYHTDLFLPIFEHLQTHTAYTYERTNTPQDIAFRVLADHARAISFLIAEGQLPSHEGPGYVLRRLMRRAIRHAQCLQAKQPLLEQACSAVIHNLGHAYPELQQRSKHILTVTRAEEDSFGRTLTIGTQILQSEIQTLLQQPHDSSKPTLSGEVVFKLYDTYGFPKDLTALMAQEHAVAINDEEFEAAMSAQQKRSRKEQSAILQQKNLVDILQSLQSILPKQHWVELRHVSSEYQNLPLPYRHYALLNTQIKMAFVDGKAHNTLPKGTWAWVFLDPNPFYAESGGQIGDTGVLLSPTGECLAAIHDTQKYGDYSAVYICAEQDILVNTPYWTGYLPSWRAAVAAHHSATHLLHYALRKHLGTHISQAGSWVGVDGLRFDFTHPQALTAAELEHVNQEVRHWIKQSLPISIREMPLEHAKNMGAMALFDEKYGEYVRVIEMGPSRELCGGTHVHNTADIHEWIIVGEEANKSGVRRIHAKAGLSAQKFLEDHRIALKNSIELLCLPILNAHPSESLQHDPLYTHIQHLLSQIHNLQIQYPKAPPVRSNPTLLSLLPLEEMSLDHVLRLYKNTIALFHKQTTTPTQDFLDPTGLGQTLIHMLEDLSTLKAYHAQQCDRLRSNTASDLLKNAYSHQGHWLLIQSLPEYNNTELKHLSDDIRQQQPNIIVLLLTQIKNKHALLLAKGPTAQSSIHIGQLMRQLTQKFSGQGGGKADFASGSVEDTFPIAMIVSEFLALLPPS